MGAGQRLADASELRIEPVLEVALGVGGNTHLFKEILEISCETRAQLASGRDKRSGIIGLNEGGLQMPTATMGEA